MNMMAARKLRSVSSTQRIDLRLGKVDDAERITDLLGRFFDLTIWAQNMRFNHSGALDYLRRAIGSGFAPHVLAYDGDELVGLCSYHIYSCYTDKPIAVMDETFVLPRLRRTDIGRRLVFLAIDLARGDGCAVMNFPIASGMKAQTSLMNMVARHFGAEPVGVIFRKVL